jgi:hypothetical protein
MTARRSIRILNLQTRRDFLETSAGEGMAGATEIFEREIEEEEIVCLMQSFVLTSAHQRVR